MDFSLTPEQVAVRDLAAQVLQQEVSAERLKEVEGAEDRFDATTWAALAASGLLGVALPEDVGGAGMG